MSETKRKKLSPREAKTLREVCRLTRETISTRHGWILAEGVTVTIARQKNGEKSEGMVTLPKSEFDRLIDWYQKEQAIR